MTQHIAKYWDIDNFWGQLYNIAIIDHKFCRVIFKIVGDIPLFYCTKCSHFPA